MAWHELGACLKQNEFMYVCGYIKAYVDIQNTHDCHSSLKCFRVLCMFLLFYPCCSQDLLRHVCNLPGRLGDELKLNSVWHLTQVLQVPGRLASNSKWHHTAWIHRVTAVESALLLIGVSVISFLANHTNIGVAKVCLVLFTTVSTISPEMYSGSNIILWFWFYWVGEMTYLRKNHP